MNLSAHHDDASTDPEIERQARQDETDAIVPEGIERVTNYSTGYTETELSQLALNRAIIESLDCTDLGDPICPACGHFAALALWADDGEDPDADHAECQRNMNGCGWSADDQFVVGNPLLGGRSEIVHSTTITFADGEVTVDVHETDDGSLITLTPGGELRLEGEEPCAYYVRGPQSDAEEHGCEVDDLKRECEDCGDEFFVGSPQAHATRCGECAEAHAESKVGRTMARPRDRSAQAQRLDGGEHLIREAGAR